MNSLELQYLPQGMQRAAAALKVKNHPHTPVMLAVLSDAPTTDVTQAESV